MKRHLCSLLLAAGVGLTAFAPTSAPRAAEVGGIAFDDRLDLHGSRLLLNGAGLRYKAVFKVYAAGLYLGAHAASPDEVLAQPGPKRIRITMLREIDAAELGRLFTRGVEDNAPKAEMSRLVPGLIRMSQIFSEHKRLAAGDTFTVDWVPGRGTVIAVRGQLQGEPLKEPEFFNALVRIWLGPVPADWKLKEALLGKGS